MQARQKALAIAALSVNALIFVLVCVGTVLMVTGFAEGASLTATGLRALRYFTVQSNLLVGLAALVYALFLVPVLRGKKDGVPVWAQVLLLMASASVGLTFLVVACFFVPVLQAKDMFAGANFFFHLVVPLLSLVSYVLFDGFARIKTRVVPLGAVPMLLYGIGYMLNCFVNGVGDYADPAALNDWYWFLYWGLPVGIGFFVVLCAVTVGLTALLRWANQKLHFSGT